MADFGTVKLVTPDLYGSTVANVSTIPEDMDVAFGTYLNNALLPNYNHIVPYFDYPFPKIPPVIGQLWPRGMVGPYRGVFIPGTVKLKIFITEPEAPPSKLGQLWPRGDFIPSEND